MTVIRLEHGLAYVQATVSSLAHTLVLENVILDTGSASTVFSADRLLEIGVKPEQHDTIRRIRGVGGTEFVFTKHLDRLQVGATLEARRFEVEVGALDYGFPVDGILGLDFLRSCQVIIDLDRLELRSP
jgi:hypothetical protein